MFLWNCLLLFVLIQQRLSKSALNKDKAIEDKDEALEAQTIIEEYSKLESENIAVSAADSYSLYKQLMEVKQQLTSTNNTKKVMLKSKRSYGGTQQKRNELRQWGNTCKQVKSYQLHFQEPAAVTTLKSALSLLYESIWEGVFKGFIPHVERQRREAEGDRQVYLEMAVTTIGAVMGKQNCSKMIACRLVKVFL